MDSSNAGFYVVAPAPDGSVWGSSLGYPGAIIRLNPGPNPPETALAEYYELPVNEAGELIEGFSPRGMDVDRDGVAWVALASGHMASIRSGWTAGWTIRTPAGKDAASGPASARAHRFTWKAAKARRAKR